jgi:hypothetical protein
MTIAELSLDLMFIFYTPAIVCIPRLFMEIRPLETVLVVFEEIGVGGSALARVVRRTLRRVIETKSFCI